MSNFKQLYMTDYNAQRKIGCHDLAMMLREIYMKNLANTKKQEDPQEIDFKSCEKWIAKLDWKGKLEKVFTETDAENKILALRLTRTELEMFKAYISHTISGMGVHEKWRKNQMTQVVLMGPEWVKSFNDKDIRNWLQQSLQDFDVEEIIKKIKPI